MKACEFVFAIFRKEGDGYERLTNCASLESNLDDYIDEFKYNSTAVKDFVSDEVYCPALGKYCSDINGNSLYLKDIIEYSIVKGKKPDRWVIEYEQNTACFVIFKIAEVSTSKNAYRYRKCLWRKCKRIGNFYTNPELILLNPDGTWKHPTEM